MTIAMRSSHTSFPDTARSNGHKGDGVFYPVTGHYDSEKVLLIFPKKLHAVNGKLDMIFWFHGWHNNVDTAAQYYQLVRQMQESGLNAVLVMPEAAKDAADSYGGKLELPGVFKKLVEDVLAELGSRKVVNSGTKPGNILLGGHSGGGEVISFIVDRGQVDIREVVMFDGLYDGTEMFMAWLAKDKKHRFVHMDTDFGYGPKDESLRMMKLLDSAGTPYQYIDEDKIGTAAFPDARILFIHSKRQHNDIIFSPDNFRTLFEHSPFLLTLGHKEK